MNLYKYHQLNEIEQMGMLYCDGIYLGKRRQKNLPVVVYQLFDFYVEIYYRTYRKYIKQIKYFHSLEQLNPYLDQIDLDELMKYAEKTN